jgi:hypothetical protein
MNSVRREVLSGLFVIVLSTLLSAAIAAFQLKFNLQDWADYCYGRSNRGKRLRVV